MQAMQLFALTLIAGFTASAYCAEPIIGLITKIETNPFFVKMKEAAKANGAKLMSAAQPSVPIALNPDGAFTLGIKVGRRSLDVHRWRNSHR